MNFKNILEILNINKDDLRGNKELTNDYLVEELVLELGYDRKRDRAVKKYKNEDIDWKLHNIGVIVIGFDNNYSNEELLGYIEKASNNNCELLLITDGLKINIVTLYNNNSYKLRIDRLSSDDTEVINALTYTNYNKEYLDNVKQNKDISLQELTSLIANNINIIADYIVSLADREIDLDKVVLILHKLIGINIDNNFEYTEVIENTTDENIDELEIESSEELEKYDFDDNIEYNLEENNESFEDDNDSFEDNLEENNESFEDSNDSFEDDNESFEDNLEDESFDDSFDNNLEDDNESFEDTIDEENRLSDTSNDKDYILENKRFNFKINDVEYSTDNAYKFVGRALQILYKIKSYIAMQVINDYNLKLIEDNTARNDLIINKNTYDIDLSNMSTYDIIYKLYEIFSNFKDIDSEFSFGEVKLNDDTDIDNNYTDEEDGLSLDDLDNMIEESVEEKNKDYKILCAQIGQLNSLIWSDSGLIFNNIYSIGSSNNCYNINSNHRYNDNASILNRSLEAILALAQNSDGTKVIEKLKQCNLSSANRFIKPYNGSNNIINNTKFAIEEVSDIKQISSILIDICEAIMIDTRDIFIYFEAENVNDETFKNWGYEKEDIILADIDNFDSSDNDESTNVIIKGSIYNRLVITKNSLEIYKKVINKALAVKNNYLGVILDSHDKYVDTVKSLVEKAISINTTIDYNSIGNVIGENFLLVSEDETLVSNDNIEVIINNNIVYISRIDDWQIPFALIKIHTSLMNDMAIAVKTSINMSALNYYNSNFVTSEPSFGLAVNSLIKYLKENIK